MTVTPDDLGIDPTGGMPPFELPCGCHGYTDTINGVRTFVLAACSEGCKCLAFALDTARAGGKRIEIRSGND